MGFRRSVAFNVDVQGRRLGLLRFLCWSILTLGSGSWDWARIIQPSRKRSVLQHNPCSFGILLFHNVSVYIFKAPI
jgi:hypothetical protein